MNARYLWNALKAGAEVQDYTWVDLGLQPQPDRWKVHNGWYVHYANTSWVQEEPVRLRDIIRIARNWDENMWLVFPEPERDEFWYIPF